MLTFQASGWRLFACLENLDSKSYFFFLFLKKYTSALTPTKQAYFSWYSRSPKNPCRFPLLWKNHFSKIIIAYSIFKDLFPISKYFCFVKRETTSQVIKIYFGICCGKEYFYFYKNIGLEK